jgi:hypothetical protein
MSTGFRILCVAAIAALTLPLNLQAQVDDRPMYELPSITVTALSESDPLFEAASILYQAGEWEAAAKLYREAAETMPENDPNSYAEAAGDKVSAAYRHVDAAFISVWEGYPGMRREHVAVAEKYASEEGFGEEDKFRVQALTRGVSSLPVEGE